MEKYKDPKLSPQERAKDLLSCMSLEEKMAQVSCLPPANGDWDMVHKLTQYGIGQVGFLDIRNIESLEELCRWQRKIQQIVMDNSPHHIPAAFHMEGLCGPYIQDSTSYPSGIARGSTWDPELEYKIAKNIARQELICGFTQILAPVLDVTRDPRMGRQGESYGEDPALVSAMGVAYTKGLQSAEIAERRADATAKHFLAFHNSQGGIAATNCEIGDRALIEIFGKPFQAAIQEADMWGVMPCYCSINGEPVSSSRKLLTDLLRTDMGFKGSAISDYGAIHNIYHAHKAAETMTDAGLAAMEAGMDSEMPSVAGYNKELMERFRSGDADIAILDLAVKRILEAKFRMGLFENPFAAEGEALKNVFYNADDRSASLQAALESVVLLKNDGALPLKKEIKKIAVVGCHAKNARSFFGGYTHMSMVEAMQAVANSIAGLKSESVKGKEAVLIPGTQIQTDETPEFDRILKTQKPQCRSLLEELRLVLPDTVVEYAYGYPVAGDDLSHIDEALQVAADADLIIMTLGGKYSTCSVATAGEGVDSTNINLPVCQDMFIRRATELGIPMVGIHFDGRPISSDIADEYLNAIVEAWNPAEMGAQAIAQILTGQYNPGGKLPVCIARSAGQIPVYYNHPNGANWHQGESVGFTEYVDMSHKPRYFFGHGLSYTTFAYSNMRLSCEEIGPMDTICVEVDVENTGHVAGEEVVQMYFVDPFASMVRPCKELAGFKRVHLCPGEKKTVCFSMDASQTAFLDRQMKWKIEKGEIVVQIGASSEDIRGEKSFTINDNAWIEGKKRSFYAKVQVRK